MVTQGTTPQGMMSKISDDPISCKINDTKLLLLRAFAHTSLVNRGYSTCWGGFAVNFRLRPIEQATLPFKLLLAASTS